MKTQILTAFLALGISLTARAALYTETFSSGFANSGNIPDGSTGGWSDTRTVSDITIPNPTITGITVTLNISGGYNGDLYGYLSYDGQKLVLLNRVGTGTGSSSNPTYYFGYGDAGFAATLSDGASGSIHTYQDSGYPGNLNGSGQVTGTYTPDSGGVSFDTTYGGLDPNGNWTLFLADESTGGGQSQLTGWSLGISAVPEPVNTALAAFGALLIIPLAFRRFKSLRCSARK